MAGAARKWWWLPGSLMAVAGIFVMAAAAFSDKPGLWVPIGAVWIILAGMNIRRRAPPADSAHSPGDEPRA